MKFQELIDKTDLDMTEAQVKAFFLGVLSAERPMPFAKAMSELLSEAESAQKELESELKKTWDSLSANLKPELEKMFPQESNIHTFMEISKDQLDYFLTAMSLSGTNTESCKNEALSELIDELEDTVEDMDEFLTDEDATKEDGEEFKEFLLGTWADFVALK
jgi:hypothetical protein